MEKRYQVFVSSTFTDLQEERAKVIQALLEDGQIPTGMELWPAGNPAAWKAIQRYLTQCDYYVLIVGGRYGSLAGETKRSYTEMEYDEAVSLGVPVLAFVHADPKKLTLEKSEQDQDGRARLAGFVKRVRARHLTKDWENGDELRYLVTNAVRTAIVDEPRIGWVRADVPVDPRLFMELDQARREIAALEEKVERLSSGPPASASKFAGLESSVSLEYGAVLEERQYSSPTTWRVDNATREPQRVRTTYGAVFERLGFQAWGTTNASLFHSALVAMCREFSEQIAQGKGREWHCAGAEVPEKTVHQLVIQFLSLGLIAEGEDQRTSETWWTLTPHGRAELVRMLAKPATTP